MNPSQSLFLASLLFLFPTNLYAAQEMTSVETKIKTLMLGSQLTISDRRP